MKSSERKVRRAPGVRSTLSAMALISCILGTACGPKEIPPENAIATWDSGYLLFEDIEGAANRARDRHLRRGPCEHDQRSSRGSR